MGDLWSYLLAVLNHWVALMSGGIITVLIALWERRQEKSISTKWYLVIIAFFILLAMFLAWRDQFKRAEGLEAQISNSRPYFTLQSAVVQPVKTETGVKKGDEILFLIQNVNGHPATQIHGHLVLVNQEITGAPLEHKLLHRSNDVGPLEFFSVRTNVGIPTEMPPIFAFYNLVYRDAIVPEREYRQSWYFTFTGCHNGLYENLLIDIEADQKTRLDAYLREMSIDSTPVPAKR